MKKFKVNVVTDLIQIAEKYKKKKTIFVDGLRCAKIKCDGVATYIECSCFGGNNYCKNFENNECKIYKVFAVEE